MTKDIELESLISILPIGIVVVDEDKKITSMNPYARDTIIGKEAYEKDIIFLHKIGSERQAIQDYFSRLSSDRNVELPLVKIFNFKNKPSLFLVRLTKIYDKQEHFKGIVALFCDLTSLTLSKTYGTDNKLHTVINKLPVMQKEKIIFLNTEEISFIKSVGSSSLIFDMGEDRYYSNLKISELEEKLNSKGFFRCHKSYLVNLSHIKEMHCKNAQCRLYLKTSQTISVPISRRNKTKLNEILTIR